MNKEYEALHNISIPMDDDTDNKEYSDIFDWDEAIEESNIWRAKWYNKYFVIPVGCAYRWLCEVPNCIKYFIQRGRRGWSDQDAWGIDYWLVSGLIPMLERLKKDKLGVPSSMYRDDEGYGIDLNLTDDADRLAEQRWDNILGEILYGLKCAKKLQDLDYDYKDGELAIRLTKSAQKSFTLIGKHLFSLWD